MDVSLCRRIARKTPELRLALISRSPLGRGSSASESSASSSIRSEFVRWQKNLTHARVMQFSAYLRSAFAGGERIFQGINRPAEFYVREQPGEKAMLSSHRG
jgi:hypothetical protein